MLLAASTFGYVFSQLLFLSSVRSSVCKETKKAEGTLVLVYEIVSTFVVRA